MILLIFQKVCLRYQEMAQFCSEIAEIFGERGAAPPLEATPCCACGQLGPYGFFPKNQRHLCYLSSAVDLLD